MIDIDNSDFISNTNGIDADLDDLMITHRDKEAPSPSTSHPASTKDNRYILNPVGVIANIQPGSKVRLKPKYYKGEATELQGKEFTIVEAKIVNLGVDKDEPRWTGVIYVEEYPDQPFIGYHFELIKPNTNDT